MVDMGVLMGTIRRFGLVGPAYEIVAPAEAAASGEPQMRIHVLESDEHLDYPVSAILADPTDD
ncbi:MAG TPA: DUF5397 family protein [Sphingomonas sp.]|jgi:hypothetical protein|uniref:DUF5397 family protein n=1 Tax=Sphingomonas sp. TaxID=28214 RepID=UPI002ED9A3D2